MYVFVVPIHQDLPTVDSTHKRRKNATCTQFHLSTLIQISCIIGIICKSFQDQWFRNPLLKIHGFLETHANAATVSYKHKF